jgi:prepilin-type N-terminal cleavage/methylation domain-containing protein
MHSERGYTVMELAIALVVVGVVATSTLTTVGQAVPTWRIRKACSDLAVTIQAARVKAVLEQRDVAVPIDVDRGIYTLSPINAPEDVAAALNSGTDMRFSSLPAGVRFSNPTNHKVVSLSPPGTPDDEAVLFDSSGMLRSVANPGYIHIGVPEKDIYRRLRVSVAGTVRVEKWNGQQWR